MKAALILMLLPVILGVLLIVLLLPGSGLVSAGRVPDPRGGGTSDRLVGAAPKVFLALPADPSTTTMPVARTAPIERRTDVWQRLAMCESGGRWHIANTIHQGGLQFAAGTWDAFKPDGYPDDAQDATEVQQIEVARRVLARQGPQAWPTCGPRVGLTRNDIQPKEQP